MPSSTLKTTYQEGQALSCTLCQTEFTNKKDWLKHLTRKEHQHLTKNEFLLEMDDQSLKECCIVVYTDQPLTPEHADEITQYFSIDDILVTDFIWWKDRAQIGILQFESRRLAWDIVHAFKDSLHIETGNLKVQLKRALELLEFEWNGILPSRDAIISQSVVSSSTVSCSFAKKGDSRSDLPARIRQVLVLNSRTNMCDSDSKSIPEDNASQSRKQIKTEDQTKTTTTEEENETIKTLVSPRDLSFLRSVNLPTSITPSSYPLQYQFWLLRKSVLIPDDEYENAMSAINSLSEIVLEKIRANAQFVLFGNWWYLKLRNPNCDSDHDRWIMYLYNPKSFQQDHQQTRSPFFNDSEICQIMSEPTIKKQFCLMEDPTENQEWKIKYISTNITLSLVTLKELMMEVQVCRLLEYLCAFDPRCYPVLTLAVHWITVNCIYIGDYIPRNPERSRRYLPRYLATQWLVLFFMCHKNYIPTPQDVLNKPHEILIDPLSETDIGFHADSDFVKEWKNRQDKEMEGIPEDHSSDEFILSVLKIFQEFLQFCGTKLAGNSLVLNTKFGKVLASDGSFDELPDIRNRSARKRKITGHKLYMTHPFIYKGHFLLSSNPPPFLGFARTSGYILRCYLRAIKDQGIDSTVEQWGTLESVLTINMQSRLKIKKIHC